MKFSFAALTLAVTAGLLTGCQTFLLKPASGNIAFATIEHPVFWGDTRITVSVDGKSFTGIAGKLRNDSTGDLAKRFGWKLDHKHPNIKQEVNFLFGSTTLVASDGMLIACDHLKHGDDWRLRCQTAQGKEVTLYPFKQ